MENALEDCRLHSEDRLNFQIDQEYTQSRVNLRVQEVNDNFEPFSRDFKFGHFKPFQFTQESTCFGFKNQPKPWFPPALKSKIEKLMNNQLSNKQTVSLLQDIAEISTDFYSVKSGRCIAIKLDGKIAESAESEFDLLLKIQGIKFDAPIFVWKVGSNSFAGWKVWKH